MVVRGECPKLRPRWQAYVLYMRLRCGWGALGYRVVIDQLDKRNGSATSLNSFWVFKSNGIHCGSVPNREQIFRSSVESGVNTVIEKRRAMSNFEIGSLENGSSHFPLDLHHESWLGMSSLAIVVNGEEQTLCLRLKPSVLYMSGMRGWGCRVVSD